MCVMWKSTQPHFTIVTTRQSQALSPMRRLHPLSARLCSFTCVGQEQRVSWTLRAPHYTSRPNSTLLTYCALIHPFASDNRINSYCQDTDSCAPAFERIPAATTIFERLLQRLLQNKEQQPHPDPRQQSFIANIDIPTPRT